MKRKTLLILFCLIILGGCRSYLNYWNAEIFNNGNQLRLINIVWGNPSFYLDLLPLNICKCSKEELLSCSGEVKYLFTNDSSIIVNIYKKENETNFSKIEKGKREDGKDWVFAYCDIELGSSFDKTKNLSEIKEIYYSIKGEILLKPEDTLRFNSTGKFCEGKWDGNWTGK